MWVILSSVYSFTSSVKITPASTKRLWRMQMKTWIATYLIPSPQSAVLRSYKVRLISLSIWNGTCYKYVKLQLIVTQPMESSAHVLLFYFYACKGPATHFSGMCSSHSINDTRRWLTSKCRAMKINFQCCKQPSVRLKFSGIWRGVDW